MAGDRTHVDLTSLAEGSEPQPIKTASIKEITSSFFAAPKKETGADNLVRLQKRLMAVYDVAQAISQERNLKDLLARFMDKIFELIPAHNGVILLKDPDTGTLLPKHVYSKNQDKKVVISSTIVNQVVKSKQAVITLDAGNDARFDAGKSIVIEQISSAMCVPMLTQDETVGMVYLDTHNLANAFRDEDLELLVALATSAAIAVKNIQVLDLLQQSEASLRVLNEHLEDKVEERTQQLHQTNSKLTESLEQLEQDEKAGRKLQAKLLPDKEKSIGKCTFSHFYMPSMYLSGDILDYFPINSGHVCFYLADVSGHGVSSAIVTVMVRDIFNHHLDNYRQGVNQHIINPAEMLKVLNEELLRSDIGKFITIFYGIIDLSSNVLTYANGGHFPPPLFHDGENYQALESKSPAVGMFDFANYDSETLDLKGNSSLYIFSDGLLDILPQDTVVDKLARLRHIAAAAQGDLEAIIMAFIGDRHEFLPDDITVLKLEYGAVNG